MPMNVMIQKKRKEMGLTQEQVADYLNVSIPAVSKWENGSTCPDISLLPSLARLLKIDLNTLFCFQEDMTAQEIDYFCKELMATVRARGLEEGFAMAEQKIHEYPHNETLLHYLTLQLDGLLTMSGLEEQEARRYEDILGAWYRRLAESGDSKIRNSALYMIASRCIRKGDYDRAQEVLDCMPDREDLIGGTADKQILQVNLYQRQGQMEKAARDLQNLLLLAVNKVQMLLYKMVDVELAAGDMQAAASIADKAAKLPELFDLWEYNAFVAPLQIAGAEQNADACIAILRDMLEAILTPWDMGSSPLYDRIAKASDQKQMLPAILSELERDSAYEFLQSSDEFKALISEYKARINFDKE